MNHNSPLANAEFELQFCETNLRYLLTDNPRNPELIEKMKKYIEAAQAKINKLK